MYFFASIFKLNTMKSSFKFLFIAGILSIVSCGPKGDSTTEESKTSGTETVTGQSGVQDDVSNPNAVQVALSSIDHTTLVTAVKAAELVDALSNAGPFTVFAPTNAAFDKLPAGTVGGLLKPEKKDALIDILQYHVFVGVLNAENLAEGQTYGQVNGGNIKITMVDGKPVINGKAHILASIKASNGMIHVIDEVLLPQ